MRTSDLPQHVAFTVRFRTKLLNIVAIDPLLGNRRETKSGKAVVARQRPAPMDGLESGIFERSSLMAA
jgi:hypothetical protein